MTTQDPLVKKDESLTVERKGHTLMVGSLEVAKIRYFPKGWTVVVKR